jgi:hypothetical protein
MKLSWLFICVYRPFLAHLSWRLNWAFLITCFLSSINLSICKHTFRLFLQNHWTNFSHTWHTSSFGEGIQVYSNDGEHLSPRGDNIKSTLNLFSEVSRTSWQISIKLSTNHYWVKGIQVHWNKAQGSL